LFAERFDLFAAYRGTTGGEIGDVTGQIVAGRRVYQPENDHGKKGKQYWQNQ
jgi:hypothetical protein